VASSEPGLLLSDLHPAPLNSRGAKEIESCADGNRQRTGQAGILAPRKCVLEGDYGMTDILLTGAGGQVGSEIGRRGRHAGLTVCALDHLGLDITDRDAIRAIVDGIQPRIVVNAAAYTAVDRAESDRAAAFAINRTGPSFLAEACAKANIPIVHLSTDYVFDGRKNGAYHEADPTAPLGIYGASKLAGEEAVRSLTQRHIILRTSWVYGVYGHNFVKTMLRLAETRDSIDVVDDQSGCPTFAGDLAAAVLQIARAMIASTPDSIGYGTFHCAGAGETTWCGFAHEIFELAGLVLTKTPTVKRICTAQFPTAARRPQNSVLDCGRLDAVHGIRLRPWRLGLKEMLQTVLGSSSYNVVNRGIVRTRSQCGGAADPSVRAVQVA